ncbi:hypothetical protein [Falsirhodobacter sp. 1013]|uniref:hypothetical protein n=1 Tax=Falsirhodobacter sp. 1013 TaxID=3417566 RepID=UPI003EB97FBE
MADFLDNLSDENISGFLVGAGSGRGSDYIKAADLMKLLPLFDERRQVVTAMEVQDSKHLRLDYSIVGQDGERAWHPQQDPLVSRRLFIEKMTAMTQDMSANFWCQIWLDDFPEMTNHDLCTSTSGV